ncbi:MAG: anhydro-N-acetylmuramic acid kinase [Acidobacteriales bacterium]|nr:anhydro-N-acetylmuramic acid kinase [Terriglobales bacterium]
MRVAGLMSGTSLDGIDVAIVDIARGRHRTVSFATRPYPARVREMILGVSNAETHTREIARLNVLLGELYAGAILHAGVPLSSIDLIGCHGQTIYHEGGVATLQIGEAAVIAERLRKPVVSDFRPRDIAAGGQGAPLVPYVDYLLFKNARKGRVALNIGGIANITAIPANGASEDVIAFDTGPGNMVVDALVSRHTHGRETFDRDGRFAGRGKVDTKLLRRLLNDAYYCGRPPKSAGREQYGAEFIERLDRAGLSFFDRVATATALTAAAVAEGVRRWVIPKFAVQELIVSGGGAHNPRMMAYLAAFLKGVRVTTSAEFGIDVDAKEAIAFALLAYETWRGRAGSLTSATGARRPVILGKITPA